jgi:hypothetical protein
MDKPNGVVEVPMHELVIRWIPSNGQLQFGCSTQDPVLQLGMIEMAKVAMIEQRAAAAAGKGPSLIVPARFS